MPGLGSLVMGLFYLLLVFGSIIFLAYVSTKVLGSKVSAQMKGRHFRVVDSIALGFDKQIYLVKVGEQLFIAACSNKVINSITPLENEKIKLSEDDLKQLEEQRINSDNVFTNYLQAFKSMAKKNNEQYTDDYSSPEANKFRQNLNKLKGIFSKINTQENGDEKLNEKQG